MTCKNFIFILSRWMGGGVESVFKSVANVLINNGNKVYLFIVDGFDASKYEIDDSIFLVRNFVILKRVKHQLKNAIVVNFNGDWKSSVFSFLLDRKYISWVHGNPITMRSAKTWLINFTLLKKSKTVVCVCREQMELLQRHFHFDNEMKLIYNAISCDDIQQKSKEKLPIKIDTYILMCARLDLNSKDFFTLIDAYDLLPDSMKNIYDLVLLGDGKDVNKIKEYVAIKKLSDKIVFPGFDSNPFRWMKNCSCFVLSSLTEGISLVPIEAMACGVPVVLTKYHTGSAEISDNGNNALLVECGDFKGMARAIETVLKDQVERDRIINNATKFIRQFDCQNFEKKILDLFECVEIAK